MKADIAHNRLPDGIGAEHIAPLPRHRRPGIASLMVLAVLVGLGLSGQAGGGHVERALRNADGHFSVRWPQVTRSGNVLQTRLRVVADRPIGRLVIGIEPGLWRQLTTNSTLPQADSETYRGGLWRFSFGKLDAGQSFEWQIAQQVNPSLWGINRGRLVFLDGERVLAEVPLTLRVWP